MSSASGIQEESLIPWKRSASAGIDRKIDASSRNLDFIVIGAPKSGTTSLHKYLEPHPELYLLPEKEVPFFTDPDFLAQGWNWYADKFFGEAPPGKLWGKVTPQYMSHVETPGKIRELMPEVKLIALLRNPADCAWSYHKMMVRRGNEQRPFEQVLEEFLRVGRPGNGANRPSMFIGEHGRMLEQYFKIFPREQLLVLFSEEMKRNPEEALMRVLRFLGVDDSFKPSNLGRCYHVGGTRRRIPLKEETLGRNVFFRTFLRLVPHDHRRAWERRFLFWFMIWNIRPDAPEKQMQPELRERLVEFYRPDVEILKRVLKEPVPWEEFGER